jgi:hypothetical protein
MEKNCLYCGKELQFKRSTRKYCPGSCKQLAYYKRQGQSLSGIPAENLGISVKEEDVTVKELIAVKQDDFTVNDNKEENIIPVTEQVSPDIEKENITTKGVTVKQEEKILVVKTPVQKEEPYEWEESRFINSIRGLIDVSDEEDKFSHPEKYWHPKDIPYIKWVTVRVRCLLENVIKISNCPRIDSQTMLEVADAFKRLVSCDLLKWMPKNYPCTKWMMELNERIQAFAIANNNCETIRFRLSPQRKTKLIAQRFIIGDFVPKVKFTELEFETALDKIL